MTVLLSVQELTKAYGPRPLFTDLSLDLRKQGRAGEATHRRPTLSDPYST
jgi:hypothetical protein